MNFKKLLDWFHHTKIEDCLRDNPSILSIFRSRIDNLESKVKKLEGVDDRKEMHYRKLLYQDQPGIYNTDWNPHIENWNPYISNSLMYTDPCWICSSRISKKQCKGCDSAVHTANGMAKYEVRRIGKNKTKIIEL